MIKTALYPESYEHVKMFLNFINNKNDSDIKSMYNSIWELRGTPQNTVDWQEPDVWILERLEGKDQEIAKGLWLESKKQINPRHIRGLQFLINNYELVDVVNEKYQITNDGKTFISSTINDIVRKIDTEEGLVNILYICSINENSTRKYFLEDWEDYLKKNSNYTKQSVIKDSLRRRLTNLVNRGLITRDTIKYDITKEGKEYLNSFDYISKDQELSEEQKLIDKVNKYNAVQRKNLYEILEKLSPFEFEELIKTLLDEMGYEDVEVTSPTNDKGVDVIGTIQNGITSVKEVIQVKKFVNNVQRPVLDQLRGCLHRFDAFKGTIITLSDFSKGTQEASLERGAAPITLINGEKLIDLLIKHNLLLEKKTLTYYKLDSDSIKEDSEIE